MVIRGAARTAGEWTAQKMGFSERRARRFGQISGFAAGLLVAAVVGRDLDACDESDAGNIDTLAAEDQNTETERADEHINAGQLEETDQWIGQTSTDADVATCDEALHADGHDADGEVNEQMEHQMADMDITEFEEEYALEWPALAEGDTKGYASEQEECCGEEDDEEDAAEILEEIQPYIEMAILAYDGQEDMAGHGMVESSQMIKNVIDPTHLFGIGKTDTEVHVCILEDESVVFAFRGTEPLDWRSGFGDVLTDLAAGQEPLKLYNGSGGPVYRSSILQAHRGFQAALKDVTDRDEPTQNLMLVLQEGLGMDAGDVGRVVCVGHSLGGALATLCAKWCREVAFPGAEIGCVTIGSPRVGNVAFAADFKSRPVVDGLSYRVVNKRDVVPCVPNLLSYPVDGSIYKHVSRPIYLWEDAETGSMRSRVGGMRPTWCNLGFLDHPRTSYKGSVEAVLGA